MHLFIQIMIWDAAQDITTEIMPRRKPKDYKKMMNMIVAFEEKGLSREKAAIEAFYKVKNGGK